MPENLSSAAVVRLRASYPRQTRNPARPTKNHLIVLIPPLLAPSARKHKLRTAAHFESNLLTFPRRNESFLIAPVRRCASLPPKMSDGQDELVTKPFKFVTGTDHNSLYAAWRDH